MKRGGLGRKGKHTQIEPAVMITNTLPSNPQHIGGLSRVLGRKTTLWGGKDAKPRLDSNFKEPRSKKFQPPVRSGMGENISGEC